MQIVLKADPPEKEMRNIYTHPLLQLSSLTKK